MGLNYMKGFWQILQPWHTVWTEGKEIKIRSDSFSCFSYWWAILKVYSLQ